LLALQAKADAPRWTWDFPNVRRVRVHADVVIAPI